MCKLSPLYNKKLSHIKKQLKLDKDEDAIEKLIDIFYMEDSDCIDLVKKGISNRISRGIGYEYAIEIRGLKQFTQLILKRIRFNR